jgi:hypothetical protein
MNWRMAVTSESSSFQVYMVLRSPENRSFLGELRNIAVNIGHISLFTVNKMKNAPILLGMKRSIRGKPNVGRQRSNSIDVDEEDWEMQYDLRKPDQIIVADDNNAYRDFGDSVFTAPQEDILEGQSDAFVYQEWVVYNVQQAFIHSWVHNDSVHS